MFIYKDIEKKLNESGYNSTRRAKEKILGQGTIWRIKRGESVSIKTLDLICQLTDCDLNDIVEIKKDK